MEWYVKVLRHYGDFKGRARRKEYWMFFLYNVLFSMGAMMLDHAFDLTYEGVEYGPIYIGYGFGMIIPQIAVVVRRLHDIGKAGWMILVVLIPFIGGIWLLFMLATNSQPGENQYGPNPKGDNMGF